MIPERAVLAAAIRERAAYEFAEAVDFGAHLADLPRKVYTALGEYYGRDGEVPGADPELLAASVVRGYTNPKHQKRAREYITGLMTEAITPGNVCDYLYAERVERAGSKLAAALLARRPQEEVDPLLADYNESVESKMGVVEEVSGDVPWREAIRSRTSLGDRIQVTPKALNDRLGGGLLPGHNVILLGRPNSGKSALAITMACGFARRGIKVLYAGNEDPIQDLMVRAITNITGLTLAEIRENPEAVEIEAVKRGIGNIIFKQVCPGTLKELERLVKIAKPAVLIVDQLRNISTKAENMTQNLDAIARGIRAIGIKYGVVTISVTQAGDSASGKAVLDMGDCDGSNTGIPGAADVLCGVGVTEVLSGAGLRMLSLSKNKVTSIEDHFQVKIDPLRSRISTP